MSQQGFTVGIDLGTTTSLVGVFRGGKPELILDPNSTTRSPIVPSLVAMDSRGRLVVGERARTLVNKGQGVREVKRKMETGEKVKLGDESYRPEEISALILKHLKANAELYLNGPVTDVVLSVPALFTQTGIFNTKQAGELAGLNVLHVMSEPTAAALAFGIDHMDVDEKIMVFDFGGGTLDISIVELVDGVIDVTSAFGDTTLGGKDFDEALVELILAKFRAECGDDVEITETAFHQLKSAAETCKIQLSSDDTGFVELLSFGLQDGFPVDLEVEVSRDEFNQETAHLLERARTCVYKALEPKNLRPEMIHRVLLVGGTTYIPAGREMLEEIFPSRVRADGPPDLAVAMGTTIRSAMLTGQTDPSKDILIVDSWAHGLGVEVLTFRDNQPEKAYSPLMEPNTVIPYSVKRRYSLLHFEQNEVEVKVRQTTVRNAYFLEDTVDTGISGVITDIPTSATGVPHDVEIEFSVNVDKLINLTATIPATGQELKLEFNLTDLQLNTQEQVTAAKRRVDELWSKARR